MSHWVVLPAIGALLAGGVAAWTSRGATRAEPLDASIYRERLVTDLAARRPMSHSVLDALAQVPRHLFVDAPLEAAYADKVLRIGRGQTISQPYVVALMSDALELNGTERVLEIGTGSGYQAAVLSLLAGQIDSIEIIPALAMTATERLQRLGYNNVAVHNADGYEGWPAHAPFDRIILTAAPPELPQALVDQLAVGGIVVAPIGEDIRPQRLMRWRKGPGGLTAEDLGGVSFVPMVTR